MSKLLYQLEKLYSANNIKVEVSPDGTHLRLRPRVFVGKEFVRLEIHVSMDENDFQNYHFVCFGLGQAKNLTHSTMEKMVKLNEKSSEIKMYLDADNYFLLAFSRRFEDGDCLNVSIETFDEATECIGSFKTFISKHYSEIKEIIGYFEWL